MADANFPNDYCVYCGSTKELTNDHIPPKALFAKPRPSNLITVRSCRSCNGGASKDDEYFRLMISMRNDTGDHPAVRKNLPLIYRSLEKPSKKGFQRALFGSMGEIEIVTPSGFYLGTTQGYDVDLSRLDRVAARIATGLFFHEFGKRLPPEFHVSAYSVDGFSRANQKTKSSISDILNKTKCSEPNVFGDGVFAYWFKQVKECDTTSVWVLEFYEQIQFLCSIVPNHKENQSQDT